MKTSDNKTITSMFHILDNLTECGFNIIGIEYLYVSCSSHKLFRNIRGVDLKYDVCQMESQMKGIRTAKLDVYAYYNNLCFLLKVE